MKQSLNVYLAGPITGLLYGDTTEWRDSLIAELAPFGINAYSPMRMKKHLDNGHYIGSLGSSRRRFAVERDLYDVRRADVVLFNLAGATRVSIGTMVELGAAAEANKLRVVVFPEAERTEREEGVTSSSSANPHDHLFVHELASIIVEDLSEAVQVLKGINGNDANGDLQT